MNQKIRVFPLWLIPFFVKMQKKTGDGRHFQAYATNLSVFLKDILNFLTNTKKEESYEEWVKQAVEKTHW